MTPDRRTPVAGLQTAVAVLLAIGCTHPPLEPSALTARAPALFRARFETTKGAFVVEVHRDWAPIGADRFYNLVASGFFDDQRLFRIRKNFIAQWGLHRDPTVIAKWKNANIPDDPPKQGNVRGTIAFAFVTPGTRTTQVYVNLVDNAQLDAQGFAPFGRIVDGMGVVDAFYSEYDERSGGGVRAGRQGAAEAEGNAWFDREWPKLDRLITARIVR